MERSKSLVASARSRRCARFADQVGLFVTQRAIESQVEHCRVDLFIDEFFDKMVASDEELTVMQLLKMLLSDDVREDIFSAYRRWLRAPIG
jgi:hypothetical protein